MIPDYGGKLKGATPIFKRDQCGSKGTSTDNIGYPKLREHLGAVIATMKLSSDWHDFKAK
ncbi:MAG: hypothetical protein QOH67_4085, partial [Hyphomicrobiales bacterium]|nr:hypothetical protein [Hyphomicrobiales bacterium]